MNGSDGNRQRLFLTVPLHAGAHVWLDRMQANYLLNVLRLKTGAEVLVFNGADGEWLASLHAEGRKSAALACVRQIRAQTALPDIDYMFAPLKSARLDYMVQKATEMGAGRLMPVITQRTQVARVNLERMQANAVEAAEQCGILSVPEVLPALKLDAALVAMSTERLLVFCDEDAPVADPVAALHAHVSGQGSMRPVAVLIGPEGGFSADEQALLRRHPSCISLSLGPRILRADTAAVAALALVQAVLGDGGGRV
jgi:16S rRNA (uracil1498-N3)-methyltransferase